MPKRQRQEKEFYWTHLIGIKEHTKWTLQNHSVMKGQLLWLSLESLFLAHYTGGSTHALHSTRQTIQRIKASAKLKSGNYALSCLFHVVQIELSWFSIFEIGKHFTANGQIGFPTSKKFFFGHWKMKPMKGRSIRTYSNFTLLCMQFTV